jgi:hypothetical protein
VLQFDLSAVTIATAHFIAAIINTQIVCLSSSCVPALAVMPAQAGSRPKRGRNHLQFPDGTQGSSVTIDLSTEGILKIDNQPQAVPPQALADLTAGLVHLGPNLGSGLGLAIVAAITARTVSRL